MPQQHHLAKYGLTGCLPITRDGLQQDFAGYSGPALSIHVKPAAGGSQNGLTVDGEPFSLDNSETYDITSHSMTVNLYNDQVKKGKAVGRWWISIQATNATIIAGNVAPIPNQQSTITNYYVWGLDLSGTLQGAGGIGGLLMILPSSGGVGGGSLFPCFDGNGNVVQLINPQSEITNPQSLIAAHYEYSPFGETIVATGSKADDFPFRFSTKYLDVETDLYNYGYRFYSPQMGRFLSRDPIEELGGINLFAFCANNALNRIDPYGLSGECNPSSFLAGVTDEKSAIDLIKQHFPNDPGRQKIELRRWQKFHGLRKSSFKINTKKFIKGCGKAGATGATLCGAAIAAILTEWIFPPDAGSAEEIMWEYENLEKQKKSSGEGQAPAPDVKCEQNDQKKCDKDCDCKSCDVKTEETTTECK